VLDAQVVDSLHRLVEEDPTTEVVVDLEARQVRAADVTASFDLDDYTRFRLLNGLDDIALTLDRGGEIADFEANRSRWLPTTA
jgi:3-isopropylmalate/(R)-2-methylmalate dehydratase small subunit